MGELRDLYDINSNKTDKTYRKGETIPDGYYPMVVMVVIRNSKGEFLMQKRVESKGGDWGVTGGHPKAGETPLEGIVTEVGYQAGDRLTNAGTVVSYAEPDEMTILNAAIYEYVAAQIIAAARESYASEVAARRFAMDSAGKNAQQMLDDLQLQYNRARQGAITQEITEIVAGSDA